MKTRRAGNRDTPTTRAPGRRPGDERFAFRRSAALRRVLGALAAAAVAATLGGCAAQAPAAPAGASEHAPVPPDQPTKAALLHVATAFNNDYDTGKFAAVWDRWDARSRAIISRKAYVRRHELCAPATGATAVVEQATRQPDGSWHVRYAIDGIQLVDTWYYAHHRWVFDIVKSNPRAARRYAMPFAKYAKAVGCVDN